MNTVVKICIAGVVVIGAGVGGYFAWRHLRGKKHGEKKPDEVIHVSFEKETVMRDAEDRNKSEMDIYKKKFANGLRNYPEVGIGKDMESYFAEMESPDEEDGAEEEDDISDEEEDDDSGGPYRITPGEFFNTRTYYDKVSLNYFDEDHIVSDDKDDVVPGAMDILGDLQASFDGPSAPSVIYIRNEELEVDYEVSLVNGSYQKEVLHIDD